MPGKLPRLHFVQKVLFDTNQLIQKSEGEQNIIDVTVHQLIKLLDRDIVVYLAKDASLSSLGYIHQEELNNIMRLISVIMNVLLPNGYLRTIKGQVPLQERCPVRNAYILQFG